MGLTRKELDKNIEAARRKHETRPPKKSGWERFKENAGKAATAYKKYSGKKGGGSMMSTLNRMSNYDPFGSPRKRRKTTNKRRRK